MKSNVQVYPISPLEGEMAGKPEGGYACADVCGNTGFSNPLVYLLDGKNAAIGFAFKEAVEVVKHL